MEKFSTPPSRIETAGESPKSPEQIKDAVLAAIQKEMEEKHKNDPFHGPQHPKDVKEHARRILDVFANYTDRVTPETRRAAETAAHGHDLIINYDIEENPKKFNYGQRVRHRGFGERMPEAVRARGVKKGNEELSWERIEEIVRLHDPEGIVYTPAVMEKIKTGVEATYPDAGMHVLPEGMEIIRDPATGKIIDLTSYLVPGQHEGQLAALKFDQPSLNAKSGIEAFAMGAGDLLYGGAVPAKDFRDLGNAEYRETRELIGQMARGETASVNAEQKEKISEDMLGWINSQVGFLLWQKIRFEEFLNSYEPILESSNPDALRQDLKKLYSNFDANIVAAKKRADEAREKYEHLTEPDAWSEKNREKSHQELIDLATEMGYGRNDIKIKA